MYANRKQLTATIGVSCGCNIHVPLYFRRPSIPPLTHLPKFIKLPTLTYLPYTALQKCTKTKETIEICDYYPQERQLPYQSLELLNIIIIINMLLQLSFYYHYINRFIVIITIAI